MVKYIQSLSHKKVREGENAFVAEGPKLIAEFLSSGKIICKKIFAKKEWLIENQHLFQYITNENIFEIDDDDLNKISQLQTPNKVIAVCNKKENDTHPSLTGKLSLMLDDIQDPGNLGTIIRIADWFAIDTIICSENCADCYNFKVVQASMGSLARVQIFYTSLLSFIDQHSNISIYAAALQGSSIYKTSSIKEGIILIGNESKGINESLLHRAFQKITIPRFGNAESLNAAVATGIILSHIRN